MVVDNRTATLRTEIVLHRMRLMVMEDGSDFYKPAGWRGILCLAPRTEERGRTGGWWR